VTPEATRRNPPAESVGGLVLGDDPIQVERRVVGQVFLTNAKMEEAAHPLLLFLTGKSAILPIVAPGGQAG
jgi:hypothetical protein